MLVRDVMSRTVYHCTAERSLREAAHLMRTHDVGCLPVVNEEGSPIGMLTDRDICMAASDRDEPLHELRVSCAMSKGVFSCRETDSTDEAERTMRDWLVYRLPVINTLGELIGVVSLTDIARVRASSRFGRSEDVVETLVAITRRRGATSPRP